MADRDRMSNQSSSSSSRDQQRDPQRDQRSESDQGDGLLSSSNQGLSSSGGRDVGNVSGSRQSSGDSRSSGSSRSSGDSRDEGMEASSSSDEVLPQHDALRGQSRSSSSSSRSSRSSDDSGMR